jgi:SSS family solute:Na+ symporter
MNPVYAVPRQFEQRQGEHLVGEHQKRAAAIHYHPRFSAMAYLIIIVVYSVGQIALGVWVARRMKGSSDFFVAGRNLGPGLLAATLLAANIGGGSTIGAAGRGYRDGLSAWWFVGSAAIGSVVLAAWVGPRIRQLAAKHDLKTVGDFLEWRYDSRVRATIALLLWGGTVAILAGQLLGMAAVLGTVIGLEKWMSCTIGAVVATTYFAAGGLKSSVVVNVVQLTVKLVGFAIALPLAMSAVGGFEGLHAALPDPASWNLWRNGNSGWMYVALLTPAFIVSPGLLQKVYGAKDDRSVRLGVGINAIVLFLFAAIPPLLGMIARARHPALPVGDLALPTLLMTDLPFWVGAVALAAIFSAEVSAADALLFMLATSFSQDLYKRFLNPAATDRQLVTGARLASVAGSVLAVAVALLVAEDVIAALAIFYTLLGVSLFVPIVAGLYLRRPRGLDALAAIAGGIIAVVASQIRTGTMTVGIFTPLYGLVAAAAAFALVSFLFSQRRTA